MKHLDFTCIARPKNNRAAYLKCDRATRARMTSYLFKVYVALGRAESDPFAAEDRAFVADLINMQLQGRDWTDNDLDKFRFIWSRGKRNHLVFNITEVKRGESARYDDLRRINVEAIIKTAAAEYGLVWNVERSVEEAPEEPAQVGVGVAELVTLIEAMSERLEAQQAEIDALRAEVSRAKPMVAPVIQLQQESSKVDRARLAARINAKSAERSQRVGPSTHQVPPAAVAA